MDDRLSSQLERYASQVTASATLIIRHLKSLKDEPSTLPSQTSVPTAVGTAQLRLAEAAFQLLHFTRDPGNVLTQLTVDLQVISAVRWLLHFEIFSLVPLEGSISYHELSSVANVPENLLRSHIRLAMTCHLFQESGPIGMVAHSPVSCQLASDPSLVSWGQYFANSVFPTATKNVNATAAWPGSKALNETAHNLAFNHHGSFFDYVSQDPARTVEFANSMKAVSTTSLFDTCHLCKSFDWSSLGDGVVVDMGGSTGHVSIALAESFPSLRFVVQDLPDVVSNSIRQLEERQLPLSVTTRIQFQGHSLLHMQPVKGAAVYLLRQILHDWPDREAVQILRSIVPALGPRSKIFIADIVLPEAGSIPATEEQVMRCNDLLLHQFTNTLERTLEDWQAIVSRVSWDSLYLEGSSWDALLPRLGTLSHTPPFPNPIISTSMAAPQNAPIPEAGKKVMSTVTLAPALGFVPIAVHFDLFGCLQEIGKPATAQDVCSFHHTKYGDTDLSVPLANDTLFLMGGLGFLDLLPDDVYQANAVTRFLVDTPSAQHGAMHFTSEGLLASAFLMRRLMDTKFEYPFQECDTPFQYAHKLMGNDHLAREHVYSVMHETGRLDSFNTFMTGKFGRWGTMPDRVRKLGYDLDGLLQSTAPERIRVVDIGGGRGELLLEMQATYPHLLKKENLILQEYNADIGVVPEVTEMGWNYKEDASEQPVKGALLYSMAHVLHNLSDIESIKLLTKVARVMAPSSRLLIQEFTKNAASSTTHAAMILMHAGRERTSAEWRDLAAFAGLEITFEAYPPNGECVVEMRKVLN
ncbi:hypothetical protein CBS63078_5259 [Aspergillus niger]|nr:hypothetical protein CBS63078_5259 [Aspergillus niger]KAI3021707.1 hypothetical protein CBS147347_7759 [Aspergillus niger]KAI3081846.1 hypothetical protein CBS147353_2766 [Aspergillus niger]